MNANDLEPLLAATEALLRDLNFDDNGVQGRGGNGGLISRNTVKTGDLLRLERYRVNKMLSRKETL